MATTKRSTKKPAIRSKKAPAKKSSTSVRRATTGKVDYYPNRVALGVATLAAVLLVTLALATGL